MKNILKKFLKLKLYIKKNNIINNSNNLEFPIKKSRCGEFGNEW